MATWRGWERQVKHYQDTCCRWPVAAGVVVYVRLTNAMLSRRVFRLAGENSREDPADNPPVIQVNAIPAHFEINYSPMTRPLRMHRTTRRRLIWLVTLLMLWQQTALAAYVCPTVPEAAPAAALMNSMPSMDDGCAQMQDASVSPLCQKHCLPDHATQVDAHTASVPLSALAAVPPMLASVAVVALQSDRSIQRIEHLRALPPPPMLLFCSLLI